MNDDKQLHEHPRQQVGDGVLMSDEAAGAEVLSWRLHVVDSCTRIPI